MSAENAWRIAMEAARAEAASMDYPKAAPTNEEAEAYDAMSVRIADWFEALPMPPAFRAEVEAEAEELRGMLAKAVAALESAPIEGKFGAGLDEYDRLCQALWDWRATIRAKFIIRDARALLSRLEAKGGSHE